MIEVFEGKIGGGKTYSAVKRILKHLATGGTVYTNIDLVAEECQRYCMKKWFVEIEPEEQIQFMEPSDIKRFHEVVRMGTFDCQVLMVVDEAHIFFNARNWKDAKEELLHWLTQSRKWFIDVIFITQSAETLDKQFRLQAQFFWNYRDMNRMHVPIMGSWPLQQILAKQYDYEDKKVQFFEFMSKDKKVFAAYQSFAFLDEVSRAKAEEAQRERIARRRLRKLTIWEKIKVQFS